MTMISLKIFCVFNDVSFKESSIASVEVTTKWNVMILLPEKRASSLRLLTKTDLTLFFAMTSSTTLVSHVCGQNKIYHLFGLAKN